MTDREKRSGAWWSCVLRAVNEIQRDCGILQRPRPVTSQPRKRLWQMFKIKKQTNKNKAAAHIWL